MQIILGSASRWRQILLRDAGFDFQVMSADIDEEALSADSAEALVLAIAQAKAEALLPKITQPALLVTADQLVVCNGAVRGKPKNAEQAREYLQSYNRFPAQTITAVMVTNTQNLAQTSAVDKAEVFFHPIPEQVIEQATSQGHIFHCAGGFQVEGDQLLSPYIKSIDGSLDSVQGLPVEITKHLLAETSEG